MMICKLSQLEDLEGRMGLNRLKKEVPGGGEERKKGTSTLVLGADPEMYRRVIPCRWRTVAMWKEVWMAAPMMPSMKGNSKHATTLKPFTFGRSWWVTVRSVFELPLVTCNPVLRAA